MTSPAAQIMAKIEDEQDLKTQTLLGDFTVFLERARRGPVDIVYHSIDPEATIAFPAILRWLVKHGIRGPPNSKLIQAQHRGKAIRITIDFKILSQIAAQERQERKTKAAPAIRLNIDVKVASKTVSVPAPAPTRPSAPPLPILYTFGCQLPLNARQISYTAYIFQDPTWTKQAFLNGLKSPQIPISSQDLPKSIDQAKVAETLLETPEGYTGPSQVYVWVPGGEGKS